jgi:hypothetical protein
VAFCDVYENQVDLHITICSLLRAFGHFLEQLTLTVCLSWRGGLSNVNFEEILGPYVVLVTLSLSMENVTA